MKINSFPYILLSLIIFPQFAFADMAPIPPKVNCLNCAEICHGCCGKKNSNELYGGRNHKYFGKKINCDACKSLKCDYKIVCKDSLLCPERARREAIQWAQMYINDAMYSAQFEIKLMVASEANKQAQKEASEQALIQAQKEEALKQAQKEVEDTIKQTQTDTNQKRSCSASPLTSGLQNWLLFFILMASVSVISFCLAKRLSKKS